jgi:hypothetical protein
MFAFFRKCFSKLFTKLDSSLKKLLPDLKHFSFRLASTFWRWIDISNVLTKRAFWKNFGILFFLQILFMFIYYPTPLKKIDSVYHSIANFSSHLQGWILKKEDVYMDWMMNLLKGVNLKEDQKHIGYVWLNVDKTIYKEWNKDFTPRNVICDLIKSSEKAKLIIIDIDLSFETTQKQEDENLYNYLKNYNEKPKIILAGTFDYDQSKKCVERKPFLNSKKKDSYITANRNICWALPIYYKEVDEKIRRFKPSEPACCSENVFGYPSIPLCTKPFFQKEYDDSDQHLYQKVCKEHEEYSTTINPNLNDSKPEFERIVYRIPWNEKLKEVNTDNEIKFQNIFVRQNKNKTNYEIKDIEGIEDSIVIIGGSHDEKDLHNTPIGRMPGSLIIINSIHSFSSFERLPSFWWQFPILTLFVLFLCFVFTKFGSFYGLLISFISALLILIAILIKIHLTSSSLFIFRTGFLLFILAIPFTIIGMASNLPLKKIDSNSKKEQP